MDEGKATLVLRATFCSQVDSNPFVAPGSKNTSELEYDEASLNIFRDTLTKDKDALIVRIAQYCPELDDISYTWDETKNAHHFDVTLSLDSDSLLLQGETGEGNEQKAWKPAEGVVEAVVILLNRIFGVIPTSQDRILGQFIVSFVSLEFGSGGFAALGKLLWFLIEILTILGGKK